MGYMGRGGWDVRGGMGGICGKGWVGYVKRNGWHTWGGVGGICEEEWVAYMGNSICRVGEE